MPVFESNLGSKFKAADHTVARVNDSESESASARSAQIWGNMKSSDKQNKHAGVEEAEFLDLSMGSIFNSKFDVKPSSGAVPTEAAHKVVVGSGTISNVIADRKVRLPAADQSLAGTTREDGQPVGDGTTGTVRRRDEDRERNGQPVGDGTTTGTERRRDEDRESNGQPIGDEPTGTERQSDEDQSGLPVSRDSNEADKKSSEEQSDGTEDGTAVTESGGDDDQAGLPVRRDDNDRN